MQKLKEILQKTFLYRVIYLFVVKCFRKAKKKIKRTFGKIRNKVKKFIKGKWNVIYRHYILKILYPRIYKKHSKLPVDENKVVFVEIRLPSLTNSLQLLYDKLYMETELDLHCHFLRNTFVSRKEYRERCKAFIADIATAKYVFMDEATNVNGCFEMRPETIVTQLWHGCGAFKKFGFSTADAIFGASRKDMENYPFNKNYTHVTVSSPDVIWAYEEAMRYTHESGVVKALGSSRTDIFYDEEFVKSAYDELYTKFPAAKGKKVILYAPTFRGRVAKAKSPNVLNLNELYDAFGNEYVVIMKHHPLVRKRPAIPEELIGTFAVDFTTDMSIETLLCVSDICISDYSSLVFEYSLFERPMIFLAHDLENFFDWRGFYYDYDELTPGPVVKTTEEVIEYISDIENLFDKQAVKDFRNKFMCSCDGHATERIIGTVFGDDYNKKLRSTPLPKAPYHLEPSADDFFNNNK